MKIRAVIISFILITTLVLHQRSILLSQSSAANFMPLNVGNVWAYQCNAIGGYCYCIQKYRIKITGTEVHNDKTYYITEVNVFNQTCGGSHSCGAPIIGPIRVDSATATLYYYTGTPGGCSYTPGEQMIDSFRAQLGDTVKVNCASQYGNYRCSDTVSYSIFGTLRQSRSYLSGGFEYSFGKRYFKGLGLESRSIYSIVCNSQTHLLGCVINGVLYGDTSTVLGLQPISNVVPDKFELYQNYPNPFNPTTKIRFDIPPSPLERAGVRLIIYDILGREVTTLVNEQLKPGTYEVTWDGSAYASGVYFYKLLTSDYIETKKLILMK